MTRLALALAALTVVALAAWMLLGAPRGRGDAVSRAVPASPTAGAVAEVELLDVAAGRPILETVATEGKGVLELLDALTR